MFFYENGEIKSSYGETIQKIGILYDEDDCILMSIGDAKHVRKKYNAAVKALGKMTMIIKPAFMEIKVTKDNAKALCEDVNEMLACTGFLKKWINKIEE